MEWSLPSTRPPGAALAVRIEDDDGVPVAVLRGEIDLSNVHEVRRVLTDLSNLALGLVLDLRAVEYLDSGGISLLHDLAVRLRSRTQLLTIVCPVGSPPRRMLELTGFEGQALVVDELAPAIAAVRAGFGEPEPF